ncbi:hypothetical protein [Pseudomonas syringae group genomosp. 3]|nr:hypothetical protein [Pseudomonas syringae group genomosp. 3]
MYSTYKPMRNFAAKLNRIDSLIQVWQFFGNLDHGKLLPPQFARMNKHKRPSLKDVVHPWELDILTREIILHSNVDRAKDLHNTGHLAAAVNIIRRVSDAQNHTDLQRTIYQELQRLFQQQALWRTNTHLMLARHLKIYNSPELAAILEKGTTLSIKQFYVLGVSISGHFLTKYAFNIKQDYTGFGISNEQRDAFLEKMVLSFDDLKVRTVGVQEYNENWSYTINPLVSTPLIVIDQAAPNIVICPIPFYLMYRFSEGLFFDIAQIQGYEQAYGDAFEDYVYDVTNILNARHEVMAAIKAERPEPYFIGKNEKHGVDLLVYDETGSVLIECKAKRLILKARYQLDDKALNAEIDILARYVVQNYKNLEDIVSGCTDWQPNGRSLFPVVVTLVNWNLFGPKVYERLEHSVLSLLEKAKISPQVVELYPYTVMSVEEYETALQVILQVGVKEFFSRRANENQKGWMVMPFIQTNFPVELQGCRNDYLNFVLNDLQEEIGAGIEGLSKA